MEEPEVPTEHLQEEIGHRVSHSAEPWTLGVALTCALLAGMAAVASMKAGHYANEAMILQIESANQWNYFQAKSIKEAQLKTKVEILNALGKLMSEADQSKAAEYSQDKEQIQKKAEELSTEARHYLHTHHILAHSVTMFQIAIAVGAISVLTKRRLFWLVSLGFGVVGLLFVAQWLLSLGEH
jgi:Na+-translocating ferredoxin:NAD+ oxidoreductase RnfD subunit